MQFKSLKEYPVAGKRVVMRVDYNITLKDEGGKKVVADDARIRITVPTLQYLLTQKCSIVILSHFKRPAGLVVEELRLDPMAERLSQLLAHPVKKLNSCVGSEVEQVVNNMKPGDIVMLENTRFYPEEESNDPVFAKTIASYGEVFIFDAFAAAHRDHATTTGIAKLLDTLPGFSLEEEIRGLSLITDNPPKPHVAVLGGVKISDKVKVIEALLERSDAILIGGALANTFLLALGENIGSSLAESQNLDKKGKIINPLELARELYAKAAGKIILPVDFIAAPKLASDAERKVFKRGAAEVVPKDWMYLDLGPETIAMYQTKLKEAKSIMWNGPMGAFETQGFEQATKLIAETIAATPDDVITVTGGGDTEASIKYFGLEGKFTYSSTAGGASLKFIAGGTMPIFDYLKK